MAKFLMLAFGLWLIAASAWADGGTAYLALKAAQKGTDGSAGLIAVTGERGAPQPQEWKVIFSDPAARGGIREIVASGDVIVSQRTPLKDYTDLGPGPAIALTRLNIDSDRAFEIANKQAIVKKIGFSWVDYTLRANAVGGAPMWILRLYDSMGIKIGVIQISAENGSMIMPLEESQPPPLESAEQFSDSPAGKKVEGVIGRVGGTLEDVANSVKDKTLRTVGTVEEFFTGERTIGPKDEDDQ